MSKFWHLKLLGILGFLLLGSPAYAGGMADQSTYCGSGSADSTCLGSNAFNEVGWCQGGIVYQGQCMTPSQYCTNKGNVWYNGTCISQSTYCTSVLNKVWYNGQCMDQQTYCSALGKVWYNGQCQACPYALWWNGPVSTWNCDYMNLCDGTSYPQWDWERNIVVCVQEAGQ